MFSLLRGQVNKMSAFIDGSNIYGTSAARANLLRTFQNGYLKTDGLTGLPLNINGEVFWFFVLLFLSLHPFTTTHPCFPFSSLDKPTKLLCFF
jgi:hypothetical protein